MDTHDPRQVIQLLRDHLATHDRPLAFLFGAGTSSCINVGTDTFSPLIPAIAGLTSKCGDDVCGLGDKFKNAWSSLCEECTAAGVDAHIENLLTRLRTKILASGASDRLLGLTKSELETAELKIRSTITQCASPDESKIPKRLPHHLFATWVRQARRHNAIEVFTTNYDLLFELGFETAGIPVFDGFVGAWRPFFHPECLESEDTLPGPNFLRLWKIHGSVNWAASESDGRFRIIRTSGTIEKDGSMVFPSHRKYDESRKQPYRALLDRLGSVLARDSALLVTSGYSFGDEHINAAIFTVLDRRPLSHVIALRYSALDTKDPLSELAERHSNLIVVGPDAGVIGGRWGTWQFAEVIDDKARDFFEVAFDFAKDDPTKGSFKLGDFNQFCEFLRAMASPVAEAR